MRTGAGEIGNGSGKGEMGSRTWDVGRRTWGPDSVKFSTRPDSPARTADKDRICMHALRSYISRREYTDVLSGNTADAITP